MIKYGCMALAIACCIAAPAAQAQGTFFGAGDAGRAHYDDSGLDDDSASTRALSGGYRWQAGPVVQIGIEAGLGKVDAISQDYHYDDGAGYTETGRTSVKVDYRHIGANARFGFGRNSRWFAIARGGFMHYDMHARGDFATVVNGQLFDSYHYSSSDNGGGAYFGLGVGVDLNPHFGLRLMRNAYAYSDFQDDGYSEDIGTASTTTLGLEVRF